MNAISSRKANTVATILLIAAMLVGAGVLVQTQVFPSQGDFLQRTINAFSQFVFEDPKDVIHEYALSGYNKDSGYWYCADYASPPTFEQVVGEFPEFAQALVSGRLHTLKEQFPQYDIEVTEPIFDFVNVIEPGYENVLEHVVSVSISNLTVTIRDVDRVVGMEYDQQTDYALRFWHMYKTMYEWITLNNAELYAQIDSVLASRSCAFYKDRCFCTSVDKDDYTHCDDAAPGEICHPCPCLDYLPSYEDEDCESGDSLDCQDFTLGDRQEIFNEYGLDYNDLLVVADRLAQDLTERFDNDIVCHAQVSEPFVENTFKSMFIYYPGPCPLEPLGGTCGVVPVNLFDTAVCASSRSDDCFTCPRNMGQGQFKPYGQNAFNNEEVMNECIAAAQGISSLCEFVNLTGPAGTDEFYQCPDGDGNWIIIEYDNEEPLFVDCSPSSTVAGSNRGASGQFSNAPISIMPNQAVCNPLPEGATPGPIDLGQVMLSLGHEGDDQVKELVETLGDPPHWDTVGGWLDRRGAMDITITCSDPGAELAEGVVEPMQAEIKMRSVFRHGCDSRQFRMFAWAPAMCGVPSSASPNPCPLECNTGNPCVAGWCELDDDDNPYCEYIANIGFSCDDPSNQCMQGMCVEGEDGPHSAFCDTEESAQPKNQGTACGTGNCMECDGAGTCGNKEDDAWCPLSYNDPCMTGACQAGSCSAVPVVDGTSCPGGCASCQCVGGEPVYNPGTCGVVQVPTSCTETEDVLLECVAGSSGPYSCQAPAGAPGEFDTNLCCGNQVCGGSTPYCCDDSFCVSGASACNPG